VTDVHRDISLGDAVKPAIDTLSLGTVVATFVGWLPDISVFLSIIWVSIRIYETETVQKLLGKRDGR
jgi:hypothetical protein